MNGSNTTATRPDPISATEWANRAGTLRMCAEMWRREAEKALVSDHGLDHLTEDYGLRLYEGFVRLSDAALSYADACSEIARAESVDLPPCEVTA